MSNTFVTVFINICHCYLIKYNCSLLAQCNMHVLLCLDSLCFGSKINKYFKRLFHCYFMLAYVVN